MGLLTDIRVLCVLASTLTSVFAIDCYVCNSVDKGNAACEDPFDDSRSTFHFIERECEYGFFKGTHCIKLNGYREDGSHILIRHCSDDNWGSHCGDIRFDYGKSSEKIYGCLESCDHDGCNGSTILSSEIGLLWTLVLATVWSNTLMY